MKEQENAIAQPIATTSIKKQRTSALSMSGKISENATPKAVKSRTSKRSLKIAKESTLVQKTEEEEEKSKVNEELKKELLADWLDEDDFVQERNGKLHK